MSTVPIISVTGTKGKTTTVALIELCLRKLGSNTLKVDTTGHFVKGERKSTLEDSKQNWRLVPSVCPGRYLWEFHANPDLKENGVAVLECSLGCSAMSGLGYRYHKIGVFLNVYEDHLGSSNRIQSKQDIATAKQFVFSRLLHEDSYAVFNADDQLVVDRLSKVPTQAVTRIPFGINFTYFNINDHLRNGGPAVMLNKENRSVCLWVGEEQKMSISLDSLPWTFGGEYMPAIMNLMATVAAVYGYYDGNLPLKTQEVISSLRLDPYGGRLTLLKSNMGTMVLADYAHEKVSLKLVGELAKKQISKDGRVIGVVRLAHDRTDELMRETGEFIAPVYDHLIVYDKLDGYWRKANGKGSRFKQVDGRTSQILTESIKKHNPNVERIIREDEAIKRAAEIAKPGDIVVIIVNDDIERSIGFIKNKFKAEFV